MIHGYFTLFWLVSSLFTFHLLISTFFQTISSKREKVFQGFAPFGANGKLSGALRHLKEAMKIFTDAVVKNREKLACFFSGGGKNWNFWQKYLPLSLYKMLMPLRLE